MEKNHKKLNQDSDISQSELDRYEKLDREWREYNIAAPARRALVDARLYKVRGFTWHGQERHCQA